ncbi:FecR family protein [Pedobacter gandavensis]|uniref:FecR family protein n=1 Tax=Pedobacter gandavensis TaxID=2679963 RepID=UPI0029314B8B|nr:FecR domain-containing protein [Pedobacter gandavensis]
MESADYLKLLDRIADGSATDREIIQYNLWLSLLVKQEFLAEDAGIEDKDSIENEILTRILEEIRKKPVMKTYKFWKRIGIAASFVLIAGLSFYTFNFQTRFGSPKTEIVNDVRPGTEQAVLTLADGQQIVLDAAKSGKIAEQAGINITKTSDGQVIYSLTEQVAGKGGLNPDAFNTIATPRGGQYQLQLPDGTHVWLNAASSLKYPIRFAAKNREVEIQGEGYFEVAKDPSRPFKVKSGHQELEVLGTHFNLNSYSDESAIKTTLLEGAVRISSGLWNKPRLLSPGQQSIALNDGCKILNVNPEEVLAWKNGSFVFHDEPLESILRQVARWYDVDIYYQRKPEDLIFTGVVSRNKNISAVLNALDKTGEVHFKVEGRKVTVL